MEVREAGTENLRQRTKMRLSVDVQMLVSKLHGSSIGISLSASLLKGMKLLYLHSRFDCGLKMGGKVEVILNTQLKQQKDPKEAITIAISARALFDMEEEHELFLSEGRETFETFQLTNEDVPLKEGIVYPFIKAVQMVNARLLARNPEEKQLFEIILLSTHSAEGGVRIINSVNYYGLEISKFCFLNGSDPSKYLHSNNVKLFLSACESAVCNALKKDIPAALMLHQQYQTAQEHLKVAFDGDSVLFSDETDVVFKEKGLDAVIKYEKDREHVPIGEGPLKEFAMILGEMKKKFSPENDPINTYLVTARSGNDMVSESTIQILHHPVLICKPAHSNTAVTYTSPSSAHLSFVFIDSMSCYL
ncbi:cytosolic 5'-nucleotidase 1A isoform X3 [Scyliorhinus torazame]|uniref:cytosolic 5'-nucleotidase 1A isoform X3 n=1 Tax=Scyliorhinus torazame TaxID=75743 RepID=UPI003B5C3DCB